MFVEQEDEMMIEVVSWRPGMPLMSMLTHLLLVEQVCSQARNRELAFEMGCVKPRLLDLANPRDCVYVPDGMIEDQQFLEVDSQGLTADEW